MPVSGFKTDAMLDDSSAIADCVGRLRHR